MPDYYVSQPYKPPAKPADLPSGHRVEPDFAAPYAAWKGDPSPANSSKLLTAVSPVLDVGVRAFGGSSPGPLVRSRARKLALGAFDSYDPTQSSLKTHLTNHLKGLQRYAARQSMMIAAPERVVLDHQRLSEAETDMEDQLGRPPTSQEIADRTGIPLHRQAYVRKYHPGLSEGQVEASRMSEDDEDGGGAAVARSPSLEAKASFLYPDLDPIDQFIVEHGLGLHGRPRLRVGELAKRLGRTPGAISQRAARLDSMLSDLDDVGVF